jgi:hypothetical protein
VGAGMGSAAVATPLKSAVCLPEGVNRAERRRGESREDARMAGDGLGNSLAAAQSCSDESLYTAAQGGHREARRVLQAIGRTPPGSCTVV